MTQVLTKFFIRNVLTFILPISIPVFIFSIMVMNVFQDSLRRDIDNNTIRALRMSKETIELIFSDMNTNKILIDYNPQLSLTLMRILGSDIITFEDATSLKHIHPFLKSSSYSRLYINSIYITTGNSKYFLANGDKESIADYFDNEWYDSFLMQDEHTMLWTENRQIYNLDVVSIYQRTKLNGVIVINVLQEYFDKVLDSITTYQDQIIAVLNEDNEVIFSNADNELSQSIVDQYYSAEEPLTHYSKQAEDYHVFEMPSEHHQFKYISFIPNKIIYKSPILIMELTLLSAVISLLISSALAYFFSIRNHRQISNIVKIFKLAKMGKTMPEVVENKKDVYTMILNNTINAFVNQSNIKLQLSERRYRQAQAELTALQYQINPHFLFNTLQSINFEVLNHTRKSTLANTMIEQLSEILRYSLDGPLGSVELREEIEITKKYIDIQRYRFDEEFDVTWDVEEEVLSCKTPRLLLQPIVENFIEYGTKSGGSVCHIHIRQIDCDIEFVITDNGPGMLEEHLSEVLASFDAEPDYDNAEHIGLRNVNARLRLKYGDDCGLILRSAPGEGMTVQFRLKQSPGV